MFNFPTFIKVGNLLREVGYHVINPAEMDLAAGFNPIDDLSEPAIEDCMQRDLWEICNCQHLFLLPGWEKSRGTWVELVLAMEIGLMIHEVVDHQLTFVVVRRISYEEINERHSRASKAPGALPKVRQPGQLGKVYQWVCQVFRHWLWVLGIFTATAIAIFFGFNPPPTEIGIDREP